MDYKIVLDAGHGGYDLGASYNGRAEKDDVLALAFDVGRILQNAGIDVEYTRTYDIFNSPAEKAQMANNADADFFISLHRNASGRPNQATGVETLVFDNVGIKSEMADNINENLERIGFRNRGTKERKDLVVLKQTTMPALLVEVGFIDNEQDNFLFDSRRAGIAEAIADGILDALDLGDLARIPVYKVQVGAFQNLDDALSFEDQLKKSGYSPFIIT